MNIKGYLSKNQAAERLGCDPRTIDKWIEEGLLIGMQTALNTSQQTTLVTEASVELWEQKRDDISSVEKVIKQKKDELALKEAEYDKAIKELKADSFVIDSILRLGDKLCQYIPVDEDYKTIYQDYLRLGRDIEALAQQYHVTKATMKMKLEKVIRVLGYGLEALITNLTNKNQQLKEQNEQASSELYGLRKKVADFEKPEYIKEWEQQICDIPTKTLCQSLHYLDFSTRTRNVLILAGIEYVYELLGMKQAELNTFRYIGKATKVELSDWMKDNGFQFGVEFTPEQREFLRSKVEFYNSWK